ncbi:methyl-accepting chemotaxis protein [Comamonas sp.]
MFLANMRMTTKLGLGFALVTFLTLALGSVSLWQMRQMNASTQVVVQHSLPSVSDVNNLRTLWNRFRRAEAGILNVNSVAEVEGYVSQMAQISTQIHDHEKSYEALELSEEEQTLFVQYRNVREQYLQGHQQFLQLARDKDYSQLDGDLLLGDAVTNFYMGMAEPQFAQLVETLSELAKLGHEYAALAEQKASQSFQFATLWVVAGMVLSTLVAVVWGFLVSRAVTVPVAQAMRAARSISEGDLTQDIPQAGRDEMGKLLQELSAMRGNLERVVSQVRHTADGVAISSEQIALGNTDLSSRTEEQASALQETAASMEQMASTVRHNAESALQANQLAINASNVAVRGGEVVGQVVTTMKDIDASSQKIADIIGIIDGIAFQTNILALNAAVEAARAGEQGRGFAVVAGEVRALAGRSAEAAKQIKQLIGESVQRVGQGTALVAQAGSTMEEVVAAIRHVSDLVGEISAASKEQSQGVTQVSEAIAQMDQTTQQNAALVEQSAAAAEGLKRQAKDLVDTVASFKVKQALGLNLTKDASVASSSPHSRAAHVTVGSVQQPAPAIKAAPTHEKKMVQAPRETAQPKLVKAVSSEQDDWETF